MDLQLQGRTALITGGSQGIGLATAEALAKEGANVMVSARNQAGLDAALALLRGRTSGEVDGVSGDVGEAADVIAAVQATEARFGAVDILVNNAGGTDNFGSFDDLDDADWIATMNLNVLSVVRAARAVLPGMRARDWGRIVNVSSESAVQPDAFFPHYAAAKAAVLNVTKSLSKATAGTDIRVNAVSPAFVKTPILERMLADFAAGEGVDVAEGERRFLQRERPNITAGRAGRPEEVASIITLLCSERASFVNGSNIRVDCGSIGAV